MWYFKQKNKEPVADAPKKKGVALFFALYFESFWHIIQLNLIFLLFCVGIITIPAAVTALTYQTLQIAKDKPIFVWLGFVEVFKKYFKKSLPYGIIYTIILTLIIIGFYVYPRLLALTDFAVVPLAFLIALCIVFIITNFYPFMLILYVNDISLIKLIKYSLTLGFTDFKSNMLALLIFLAILITMWWFFPITVIPMLIVVFSTTSFIISFACHKNVERNVICKGEFGEING